MKPFALFLLSLPLFGTVTVNSVSVTQTQIRFDITAPDGTNPCKFEVSQSVSYSPLAHDVDSALFSGSNLDTRTGAYGAAKGGTNRVFVAGTRDVETGADGVKYSRALQQATVHYYRISCGATFSDQVTGSTTTAAPEVGRSVRDPYQVDADHLPVWPDLSLSDRTQTVIEPYTGALIKHFGMPADALRIYNNTAWSTCLNLTSGWTIGGSCTGGSGATTFTSSSCSTACAWLAFAYNFTAVPSEALESSPPSINWLRTHFTGQCSGANTSTADCTTQICWTWDGATCAGPLIDLVVPTSSGAVTVCASDGTNNCVIGDLMGADYRGVYSTALGTGYVYTSGSSTTVNFTEANDCNAMRVGGLPTVAVTTATQTMQVDALNCGGSPPSMTVDAAINLDPGATGAAGYAFHYGNGWWRNPRWGVLIRKKSLTANNTISINNPQFDLTLGGESDTTSAGYNELCSQYLDSNGFYKCRMTTKIYAYQPTTGEVRFLGQVFGNIGGSGWAGNEECQQIGNGSTFWIDANSFVCINNNLDNTGKTRVFKVQFTGNTANDVEKLPDESMGEETSIVAGVTITDLSGDLAAAIHTFDSAFDTSAFTTFGIAGLSGGRYVQFVAEMSSQDTFAWAAVFDTTTGTVIAAWQTYATPSASRWGVNHAVFWFAPVQGASSTVNLLGTNLKQGRDDVPKGGRYHFTIPAGTDASQTSFTVSTITPVSPVAPTTLQTIAVGDVFVCDEGGANEEAMQVVTASTSMVVTRGFQSTPHTHSAGVDCAMYPHLNLSTIPGDNSGEFWDFLNYPHGPDNAHLYSSFCPGGGHAFYYSKWMAGSPDLAGNVITAGIENSLGSFPLCNPSSFSQNYAQPIFSGVAYGPQSSGGHEGHPSFKPTPYPLVLDNHPNIGEGTQLDSALTRVGASGTLFKLTYDENPFGASPDADGVSLKYLPHVATSQGRVFEDISGPGSVITSALSDAFKMCIPHENDECVSGSVANSNTIYVNSPYMDPGYWTHAFGVTCWLQSNVTDDLCFADESQRGEMVVAEIAPSTGTTSTDPNQSIPILTEFGMVPKGAPNTLNTKLLWGNWGFGLYTPNGRSLAYLVKVPSTSPADAVNRTVFSNVSVSISSPPMGTDNVIVRFGYHEYGSSVSADPYSEHYCNQRREECVANSAAITASNPFYWPVEGSGGVESGITGLACAVSCTVAIPAIPGYIAYPTVVFRNAANATISTVDVAPGGGASPSSANSVTISGTTVINGSTLIH